MLKKIIYLIVSGGLLLSGCSLDYEPLNGPSSGSFPASEEEAMAGLYAAYKGLANMTVKETPFPMRINDCISDIGTYRTGAGNQIKAMSSTLTADNTMCEKVYKTVYKIAGRVHLVLDNLDRLRGVIPEDRFNQIKAELLCIRAYYYDLGCQFYGDIPFIDHQLDLDDYSDYPRIPREQVTARLLQDLDDDLLDYLPVQWNPGTYGTTRIGRVAAYALKARIALNWGLWEEAARCSKIATTLAEGVYDLEPLDCTYYATHADGEPSAANLFGFAGQTSREWLWAIQYNRLINYTSATYYEAPRIHGGCSWLRPPPRGGEPSGAFAVDDAGHDLAFGINRVAMHFDGLVRRERVDFLHPYAHQVAQFAGIAARHHEVVFVVDAGHVAGYEAAAFGYVGFQRFGDARQHGDEGGRDHQIVLFELVERRGAFDDVDGHVASPERAIEAVHFVRIGESGGWSDAAFERPVALPVEHDGDFRTDFRSHDPLADAVQFPAERRGLLEDT